MNITRHSIVEHYKYDFLRFWKAGVSLSLTLGAASILCLSPAAALGTPSGQVYDWGAANKGGPKCNGAGCNESPQVVSGMSGAVAIDAANNFNLAIMSNGNVMAWGQNLDGDLGNGSTKASATPVQVSGLSNVVQTATGNSDAVALMSNGNVMAWGNNQYGQLGIGNETTQPTPILVTALQPGGTSGSVLPAGVTVTALAAGGNHAYALLSNGTVMAWGWGEYGQLGIGSTVTQTTPVLIPGLSNVTAISSGNLFGDALLSNGSVMDWGYNKFGQLGIGTTKNSQKPVQVPGLTGVAQVSAGGDEPTDGHNLVLLADGAVMATGDNANGQLGNGSTTNSSLFVPVVGLPTDVTFVAAGGTHSMALDGSGNVWAWGNNQYGQLGNGSVQQSTTPIDVMGGVEYISAGSQHSIAADTAN